MAEIGRIHAKVRPETAELPKLASILVVDDQRFDRARLKRLINGLEFETHVVEADRLESMGTMLQRDKFDLILIDYNLPDGNGLMALDAIRVDPKNRQAATIMVAGDGQSEVAIEALKRGCSDYITKDDLSPASFKRATINALQKSSLSIGMETQDVRRQQIEAMLERFSTECANEIKPVLSRLMRQLRDLREAPNLSEDQTSERFGRIENSCMRLWEFLDDLEQYQGTDLSGAPLSGSATASAAQPPVIVNEFANQAVPESGASATQPRRIKAAQKAGVAGTSMTGRKPRPSLFGKH
ncbi:PleD family two-component system response regulator [uncultured Roseobacter sp.]|uniref:response regulator n=1 Tax=uncultured Roseobacter sp. TaxID=114847 RepID=UPI00262488AE|nr:response regulator [uncultured Roseobacter sp.]